ncbi:MAG: hypothetical protein LBL35_06890 [Clostridiales bacterium]|nr:hypothetical protein [Clostridiales bacterium]
MKKLIVVFFLACACAGCGGESEKSLSPPAEQTAKLFSQVREELEPFDDARGANAYAAGEYSVADMITYTFDERTVFEGGEDTKAALLEGGKNPGLSIRALHEDGVIGAGVNAAIIGSPLLTKHSEYEGKILAYNTIEPDDADLSVPDGSAASVLAGETTGVAPGVKFYYVSIPNDTADATVAAKALDWILSVNEYIDDATRKIRVVALTRVTSGWENIDAWKAAKERAERDGIVTLEPDGMFWPCYYEPSAPNNINLYAIGTPDKTSGEFGEQPENTLAAPVARRTLAGSADRSFVYFGKGMFELSAAYAAGVVALGIQEYAEITSADAVDILTKSSYVTVNNETYLNPIEFVDNVRKKKEADEAAKSAEDAEGETASSTE